LFLFFFGEDDDPASFLVSLARRTVVLPKDAGRLELIVFLSPSPLSRTQKREKLALYVPHQSHNERSSQEPALIAATTKQKEERKRKDRRGQVQVLSPPSPSSLSFSRSNSDSLLFCTGMLLFFAPAPPAAEGCSAVLELLEDRILNQTKTKGVKGWKGCEREPKGVGVVGGGWFSREREKGEES